MEVSFIYSRTGEKVVIKDVASWEDQTSPYDPYVLRIIKDKTGKVIAGPMVQECIGWVVMRDES